MSLLLFMCSVGHSLIEALENGVSRYPRLDGRFPQVSGIRFQFDPYKKSGERVDADNVMINGRPLEYDKVRRCPGIYPDTPYKLIPFFIVMGPFSQHLILIVIIRPVSTQCI